MLPVLSATLIADTIASVDKLPEDDRVSLRIRMKQITSKREFLRAFENESAAANSKKLYPKRELARAAILTDAILAGFESDALVALADALERLPTMDNGHAPSGDVNGAYIYGSGLEAAIKGVLGGDPGRWLLTYSFGRSGETRKPLWFTYVTYLPNTKERFDAGLQGNPFLRPITRGEFDLTERLSQFGWMLKE